MIQLTGILGRNDDPAIADQLHHLSHDGRVEHLIVPPEDAARHRLRAFTDAGTECGIALRRDENLFDGAVLFLDKDRAIVVRMGEESWLRLRPLNAAAALELGYFAGNMHWRVRFHDEMLFVAITTSRADYLSRLSELLSQRKLEVMDD